MTPFKLWMARAEDLVLPSDLIFDIPRGKVSSCPGEYVETQKAEMQRVFELARMYIGKAVERVKVANQQKGLRSRDYKVGEWVWRFYPPSVIDKVTGHPYTGPHQVLDVSEDKSRVTLSLPEVFGRGLIPKQINVRNVKPLRFTQCGRLFIVLLSPETAEITVTLLVETETCGDCGRLEGKRCSVLERCSTQILLLEILEDLSFEELLPEGWKDITTWGGGTEHHFILPVSAQ